MSLKTDSFIPGDVYHQIRLHQSQNWEHCDVQFRGLCGKMPWSTMEVSCDGQWWIGHVALYIPQLCVIPFDDRRLHQYGLTHIRSRATSYPCWFRFYVLFSNLGPGSYFRWQLLQGRSELPGVWVAALSHWVAYCSKRLSFSSIRLPSHLVQAFLEQWLAVVEWWGRWSQKEVGSPEDYIVRNKSRWNEWQPTCTFNSSWIRLCIAALRIAAGDSTRPSICSKLVRCCLFVCRDILWRTTADISNLNDINRTLFDEKDVWWCLSQDIAGILHESQFMCQVLMYGLHDYSQWSDSQNADLALF